MRILILNETAAPIGGEMNYYVFDIASRLRAAGETVAMVHSREPKSMFRGAGYIFDHLRGMNAGAAAVRTRLEAIVDDFRPDVIQIHGAPNLQLDPWLTGRVAVTRWVHNHQFYCSGQNMTWARPRRPCERPHGIACLAAHGLCGCGSMNPVRNWMQYSRVEASLAALREAPHLQVASRVVAQNLVRNGVDPGRIEHLPLYAPPPQNTKKPPMSNRRFILHPSALVRYKGVWLLVRNLHRLPDDVDIVLGGAGGELQEPLEHYIASNHLSNRVRVMGAVSPAQWSVFFHQAEMVVMPSLWNEPLGLAGLHAMAHGKPVIAFQSGGISEWLEDNKNGVVVPFGARDAFVEATARLLNDRDRLWELGANARACWEERFKPEHHMEKLLGYYRRIAKSYSSTITRKPTS